MRNARFTEHQIIAVIKSVEAVEIQMIADPLFSIRPSFVSCFWVNENGVHIASRHTLWQT